MVSRKKSWIRGVVFLHRPRPAGCWNHYESGGDDVSGQNSLVSDDRRRPTRMLGYGLHPGHVGAHLQAFAPSPDRPCSIGDHLPPGDPAPQPTQCPAPTRPHSKVRPRHHRHQYRTKWLRKFQTMTGPNERSDAPPSRERGSQQLPTNANRGLQTQRRCRLVGQIAAKHGFRRAPSWDLTVRCESNSWHGFSRRCEFESGPRPSRRRAGWTWPLCQNVFQFDVPILR